MNRYALLDRRYVWHPFTQMKDWLQEEPIVIARGRGAVLEDTAGRRYLDGNSSIWTNLHGHNHPVINRAIRKQLGRIAHSSALGLANEPASVLAAELVRMANAASLRPSLAKVFFSDDGSTAMEVALKLAYEFSRRVRRLRRPRFLSLSGAYHGDTVGAVSLGHIDLFHRTYGGLLFESDEVMAPYCYRCPFNRAHPQRGDAREYRKCRWECVDQVSRQLKRQRSRRGEAYAGFVVEPRMQGAAGMIPQPAGWLRRVTERAREEGILVIADEVMTGLGRASERTLFATHEEAVQPDLVALAKGLTGGYLPLAATLTSQPIFEAFLGEYHEFKTFFHGHSFTGNQLGCAAALANLSLLQDSGSKNNRQRVVKDLEREVRVLWDLPQVGDIRQAGAVVGIELVQDWQQRKPYPLKERVGLRVCAAMARRGVLTRPIGNVVVLMPPYCCTTKQVRQMVGVLAEAIAETSMSRSRK